jgi:integrase
VATGDDELRERLDRLLRDAGQANQKVKVADLKDKILREKGRLSPKTLSHYEWMFGKLAAFTDYWPSEASVVNEFIGSLKGLNDESVLEIFKCLRAVGRYTKQTYGWVDPTERANRPKVAHKRRRYLSEAELKAVAGACREVRDKALILALIDSSARIGEIAGLRVEDLGEDNFKVKGKTGQRRYRCDARIISLLRECSVDGVVFPMMDSGRRVISPARPCAGNVLGDRVRVIMERAGLKGEKLGAHTLRHTAASIVARKTMSGLAVKALLQHDNIATSMKYIHDADDQIQQQVSPLELSGVDVVGETRQLGIGEGVKVLAPPGGVGVYALIEDLFPEVPEGVKVRPALDSEDLRLIRNGLMELMRVRGESGSGSRCVQLIRRILRKV